MKERKFSPLMWCHLVLMVALAIAGIVYTVSLFVSDAEPGILRYRNLLACMNVVNTVTFVFGIVYLCNWYGKKAAVYYKVFLLLTALHSVFGILIAVIIYQNAVLMIVLIAVKTVALLILALGKDLQKRNTWILFSVMLCSDLAFGFLFTHDQNAVVPRMLNSLFRLLCDGTIALAIRGKYADKEARGAK